MILVFFIQFCMVKIVYELDRCMCVYKYVPVKMIKSANDIDDPYFCLRGHNNRFALSIIIMNKHDNIKHENMYMYMRV